MGLARQVGARGTGHDGCQCQRLCGVIYRAAAESVTLGLRNTKEGESDDASSLRGAVVLVEHLAPVGAGRDPDRGASANARRTPANGGGGGRANRRPCGRARPGGSAGQPDHVGPPPGGRSTPRSWALGPRQGTAHDAAVRGAARPPRTPGIRGWASPGQHPFTGSPGCTSGPAATPRCCTRAQPPGARRGGCVLGAHRANPSGRLGRSCEPRPGHRSDLDGHDRTGLPEQAAAVLELARAVATAPG